MVPPPSGALKPLAVRGRPTSPTPIPVADITAAFTSVFAAVAIALASTYAFVPELRRWLAGRGGLVDWMTFVALCAAIVVGLWALRRSSSESRFRYVIPAIAALGVLDETRYGLGVVGSNGTMIEGIAVRSYDDLGLVASSLAEKLGLGSAHGLVALLGLAGLTALAIIRANTWTHDRVLVTEHRVVTFIVLSISVTLAAPVVGLFGASAAVQFAGGMFEMVGATFLVLAGLAAADHRRTVAGWRRRLHPWLAEEGPLASLGDRI